MKNTKYFGLTKKELERLLKEGCEEFAEEDLKIAKDGEGTLMDGLDKEDNWDFRQDDYEKS